ncbi:MAG: DUF333 domain-containing protein, partial [Syntrophothermus sp.]
MICKLSFLLLLGSLIIATACAPKVVPTPQSSLPNPASVYCEQNGGRLEMRQDTS